MVGGADEVHLPITPQSAVYRKSRLLSVKNLAWKEPCIVEEGTFMWKKIWRMQGDGCEHFRKGGRGLVKRGGEGLHGGGGGRVAAVECRVSAWMPLAREREREGERKRERERGGEGHAALSYLTDQSSHLLDRHFSKCCFLKIRTS